jgi:signal transduction histidine kinase/ActR/RegA family two-component response regulator
MPSPAEIIRLNLLVELLSECADVDDFPSLMRVVGGRFRWVVGFEACTLVIRRGQLCAYWTVERAEDTLRAIPVTAVTPDHAALLARALDSGTPGASGVPVTALCAPLLRGDASHGAICISSTQEPYAHRDLRFLFHIAQCISSTTVRLDLKHHAAAESRRKDEFLALMGHELRNPLAPIITAVELLKLAHPGAPSREIGIIERQARHLLRLVEDLSDMSRMERGSVILRRSRCEVGHIVEIAAEMSHPLLEARNHRLDLAVPPRGLLVDADDVRLAQVISNLLNNASHYTRPGGRISVAARREGGEVVIDVSDNGVGMSEETLPRIFEQFMRGPAASERAEGGLGLGLSVVKTLTALHGGTVSAESGGLGQGSKLTLRLPVLPDEEPEAIRAPAAPALATTPRRVLLVDDNEDAAELLSRRLRAPGHEVEVAHDGAAAPSILEWFHPSVAVLDIGLPVMDGYELAARIHALFGAHAPPLIAVTGYDLERDTDRGRAAAFTRHFLKPVQAAELLRAVEEVASARAS